MVNKLRLGGLEQSLRRCYIDRFFSEQVSRLSSGSLVLDSGGNKVQKRGSFDIGQYDVRVVYANLSVAKKPDVRANAMELPFRAGVFDAVLCSEVLELVPDPAVALLEAHRVLKSGALLLVCVPFLVRIHNDPVDYGRYTDNYWREQLQGIGFQIRSIEKQGLYWSVMVDHLRVLAEEEKTHWTLIERISHRLFAIVIALAERIALRLDARLASKPPSAHWPSSLPVSASLPRRAE